MTSEIHEYRRQLAEREREKPSKEERIERLHGIAREFHEVRKARENETDEERDARIERERERAQRREAATNWAWRRRVALNPELEICH